MPTEIETLTTEIDKLQKLLADHEQLAQQHETAAKSARETMMQAKNALSIKNRELRDVRNTVANEEAAQTARQCLAECHQAGQDVKAFQAQSLEEMKKFREVAETAMAEYIRRLEDRIDSKVGAAETRVNLAVHQLEQKAKATTPPTSPTPPTT
jgi:chromosome segregation ATPase